MALLGSPIERSSNADSYGNAAGDCGFGYATWELNVEGPKGKGRYRFTAEKHGGRWGLTNANLVIGDQTYPLLTPSAKESAPVQ